MKARDIEAVPHELSYEHRLRVIGSHLDQQRFHSIMVCDVAGGMLVKGTRSSYRVAEVLLFRDDTFHVYIESSEVARGSGTSYTAGTNLFPTGYEDFLRAVGYELDQRLAWHVVINELSTLVTVSGFEPSYVASGHTRFEPLECIYHADDIRGLLDEAFARRGAGVLERFRWRRKLKAGNG